MHTPGGHALGKCNTHAKRNKTWLLKSTKLASLKLLHFRASFAPMGLTSEELRWAIVTRWNENHDISKTARQLGLSDRVVEHWVQRYKDSGAVHVAPKSGKKRILSPEAESRAYDLLLSNQHGGAKTVAQELGTLGLVTRPVGKKTVIRAARRHASEMGKKLRVLRGAPRKQLSGSTRQKRLDFCKASKGRDWSHVLFTDRKKFPFTYPGVKVQPVSWGVEGEGERAVREAASPNHPLVLNVYAGICKWGISKLHFVTGTSSQKTTFKNKRGQVARNITTEEYEEVVKATFLPEGQRLFTQHDIATWYLQQDNDPTHRAAIPVVKRWNSQRGSSVGLLQKWPPNSPDLSPIENFWGYMQAKMDVKGCRTLQEFKVSLIKEVAAVPKEYFCKLVGSMPKRIVACMRKKGDKTKY